MLEGQKSYWEAPKGNRHDKFCFAFIEDKYTSGVKLSLWFAEERAIFFERWLALLIAFRTNDVDVLKQTNKWNPLIYFYKLELLIKHVKLLFYNG